jgi:hypothetical protein
LAFGPGGTRSVDHIWELYDGNANRNLSRQLQETPLPNLGKFGTNRVTVKNARLAEQGLLRDTLCGRLGPLDDDDGPEARVLGQAIVNNWDRFIGIVLMMNCDFSIATPKLGKLWQLKTVPVTKSNAWGPFRSERSISMKLTSLLR